MNLQTLTENLDLCMAYGFATYSVHCDTLITLSTLLTKCDDSLDCVGHPPIGQCLTCHCECSIGGAVGQQINLVHVQLFMLI